MIGFIGSLDPQNSNTDNCPDQLTTRRTSFIANGQEVRMSKLGEYTIIFSCFLDPPTNGIIPLSGNYLLKCMF